MVNSQRAVIDDRTSTQITGAATIAYLQRASGDAGLAGIAVVARQHRGACTHLVQVTGAADIVGQRHCVAVINRQRAVIGDCSGAHIACAATIAYLQRACIDAGGALVAVAARQHRGTRALLNKVACATNAALQIQGVAAIDYQLTVIGHGASAHTARGAAIAQLQRPCSDGGAGGCQVLVQRPATSVGLDQLTSKVCGTCHGYGIQLAASWRCGVVPQRQGGAGIAADIQIGAANMPLAIVAIDPAATVERDLVDCTTVEQHIAVELSCIDQRRGPRGLHTGRCAVDAGAHAIHHNAAGLQTDTCLAIASAVDLGTCNVVDDVAGRIATANADTAVAPIDCGACALVGHGAASQQLHAIALRTTLDGGAIEVADVCLITGNLHRPLLAGDARLRAIIDEPAARSHVHTQAIGRSDHTTVGHIASSALHQHGHVVAQNAAGCIARCSGPCAAVDQITSRSHYHALVQAVDDRTASVCHRSAGAGCTQHHSHRTTRNQGLIGVADRCRACIDLHTSATAGVADHAVLTAVVDRAALHQIDRHTAGSRACINLAALAVVDGCQSSRSQHRSARSRQRTLVVQGRTMIDGDGVVQVHIAVDRQCGAKPCGVVHRYAATTQRRIAGRNQRPSQHAGAA